MSVIRYLTCKGSMNEGVRRFLILASIPFFIVWIIPGVLFWVLVHAGVWVYDGFVAHNQWPVNANNNMIYSLVERLARNR